MKVAVFGGTGFVGGYLIDALLARGHEPAVLVSVIEKALFGELPEDPEPGQLH